MLSVNDTSKNGPEVTVFNGIVQSNSSQTQDIEKFYQSGGANSNGVKIG